MNLWLRLIGILLAARGAPRCDPTEPSRLDFRVMPTDLDVYKPERWLDDGDRERHLRRRCR